MRQEFRRFLRKSLRWERGGRHLTVFPDDIFIISYPKSGNTWTRFLIGNLVFKDKKIDFKNIESLIPDVYKNSGPKLKSFPYPRYLKSHEYFNPLYKKVIYIVRDPRDVALSYFYHCKKVGKIRDDLSINKFIEMFLCGELDPFGSWAENVGSWVGAREKDENFLLLSYENMLERTSDQLQKISNFLGLSRTQKEIDACVEKSSFSNMKRLEKMQHADWKETSKTRKDISFVRAGKTGQWREEIPGEIIKKIENKWQKEMERFGYI